MRRHRRDDDGLWSEATPSSVGTRSYRTAPTLEPADDREVDTRPNPDDWPLRFVAFVVWWLPEAVTNLVVGVISIGFATCTWLKSLLLLVALTLSLGAR